MELRLREQWQSPQAPGDALYFPRHEQHSPHDEGDRPRRAPPLRAVAAYADNNNLFDVWVMVAAGLAGYAMRGLGLSPAPLVLGLVLGPLLERSLLQALTIGRGDVRELWASWPAALMLAAAALALVAPLAARVARLSARVPGRSA